MAASRRCWLAWTGLDWPDRACARLFYPVPTIARQHMLACVRGGRKPWPFRSPVWSRRWAAQPGDPLSSLQAATGGQRTALASNSLVTAGGRPESMVSRADASPCPAGECRHSPKGGVGVIWPWTQPLRTSERWNSPRAAMATVQSCPSDPTRSRRTSRSSPSPALSPSYSQTSGHLDHPNPQQWTALDGRRPGGTSAKRKPAGHTILWPSVLEEADWRPYTKSDRRQKALSQGLQ